jgi:hypothetical protein
MKWMDEMDEMNEWMDEFATMLLISCNNLSFLIGFGEKQLVCVRLKSSLYISLIPN